MIKSSDLNNEVTLIRAAKTGDMDAYAALIIKYERGIRAYLSLRINSIHDAEDLAQETFIIAYEKLPDFDANHHIRPWLRCIAINLLRNHYRKRSPQSSGSLFELDALAMQALEAERFSGNEADLLDAVEGCVKKLDSWSQKLLKLRYTDGLTLEQLSLRLQKEQSALSMCLHRMRNALRICAEKRLGELLQ